jgi:DNA-binding SARP family transcriptional activator
VEAWAHRVLVKAHLTAGNRGAALRQYEQCRRVLLDELGLEPSLTLRNLLPQRAELNNRLTVAAG